MHSKETEKHKIKNSFERLTETVWLLGVSYSYRQQTSVTSVKQWDRKICSGFRLFFFFLVWLKIIRKKKLFRIKKKHTCPICLTNHLWYRGHRGPSKRSSFVSGTPLSSGFPPIILVFPFLSPLKADLPHPILPWSSSRLQHKSSQYWLHVISPDNLKHICRFNSHLQTYDRDIYFSSAGISSVLQMNSFGCFLDVLNAISVAFQTQFKMNTWWTHDLCFFALSLCWPVALPAVWLHKPDSAVLSNTVLLLQPHVYHRVFLPSPSLLRRNKWPHMSPRLLQQPFNRFLWTFRFFQVIPVHWIADLTSSPLPTSLKSQWLFPGVPNSPEDKDHLENPWKQFSGAQYRAIELEFPGEMSSNLVTKQQFQWFLSLGKILNAPYILSFPSLMPPFTSTCRPSKLDTFIPSGAGGGRRSQHPGYNWTRLLQVSRTLQRACPSALTLLYVIQSWPMQRWPCHQLGQYLFPYCSPFSSITLSFWLREFSSDASLLAFLVEGPE